MRLPYSFLFLLLGTTNWVTAQKGIESENSAVVCTDFPLANTDWKFLSPQLKNKNMILIGEPNHGSKEITLLRNDLIKYLHNKHGFNVILLESGIGELLHVDFDRDMLAPEEMLFDLTGPWRTKEFYELMTYINKEHIAVAGFDVQRTGNSFSQTLSEITKSKTDSNRFVKLENDFSAVHRILSSRGVQYDSISAKTKALIEEYRLANDFLESAQYSKDKTKSMIIRQTINNRIAYLTYMLQFVKDGDWNKRWAVRDSAMANNVVWLIENIYPKQKVIVVGHNFHISKYSKNELAMGEILNQKFSDRSLVIGFFATAGSYAENNGKSKNILPEDTSRLDIKHMMKKFEAFATVLTVPDRKTVKSSWLFDEIIVNDTFIDLKNSNTMILAQHFDCLVFLKNSSPPEKYK